MENDESVINQLITIEDNTNVSKVDIDNHIAFLVSKKINEFGKQKWHQDFNDQDYIITSNAITGNYQKPKSIIVTIVGKNQLQDTIEFSINIQCQNKEPNEKIFKNNNFNVKDLNSIELYPNVLPSGVIYPITFKDNSISLISLLFQEAINDMNIFSPTNDINLEMNIGINIDGDNYQIHFQKTINFDIIKKINNIELVSVSEQNDKCQHLKNIGIIIKYDDDKEYKMLQSLDVNIKNNNLTLYLEHGNFILMACTTENPYFVINPALRSRCLLLELKPISNEEMLLGLKKIITNNSFFNFNISDEILEKICNLATGDLRIAINILEILIKLYPNEIITIDIINAIMSKASNWNAKEGNEHHDLKSALQKSIRGSDVNAALHYLARLLATGDYEVLLRRMLIIVYEDIGLANPALAIRVKTAIDTSRQIGMPEGIIPLGLVVIEMALSEKSNSANLAVQKAYSDVLQGKIYPIPDYLKHNWSKTLKKSVGKAKLYKFPHDYANDYVQQQYLPTKLKDTKYYQPKLHNIYEKKLNEIYNRFTKK
ncbi:hypothetical protein [Spiroplasma endosymbiont of Lasioglossum villosulum]|uniref:AAA family ATPase n=1 Tax=Spiroplasma endosymbiont of Lasioglossum villosulum TaxID=3066320 RepID=UPI0030D62B2C